ncbi:MAG: type II toxin-antitoxin system VapC family toxin [Cyanobacteria bacterium P01_A01_bin.116]
MTLYVMDTDHLSLFERNDPRVVERVLMVRKGIVDDLFTTVVTMQEQLEGRLAQVRRARDSARLMLAYRRLQETFGLFSDLDILNYNATADEYFRGFRKGGVRIGTQDLRIALSNEGIILTRNLRDFEKVPGLVIQDWSAEE